MRLAPFSSEEKDGVLAYASIVLDNELAIKGIRLVRARGKLLASMPNKGKIRDCPFCSGKNEMNHSYCKDCGKPLPRLTDSDRIFSDMVHPVNSSLRLHIEQVLFSAYEERRGYDTNNSNQSC